MNNPNSSSITNLLLLALLLTCIIYGFSRSPWPSTTFKSFSFIAQNQSNTLNDPKDEHLILQNDPNDELELALTKASMPNKTLIIAVVNKAYVEHHNQTYPSMFDLFLESFWVGEDTRSLLDNLLIVAVDQTAYERCKFRRLNCYQLVMEDGGLNLAGEKIFMSDEFIKMMWRRTLFLLNVLKRGYNFIFTDTDVMWLRNPLTQLNINNIDDLQISTDKFNGDPHSEKNGINTGFYYIRSNKKTISLFEKWYGKKDNSKGMKEQDVLADLMHKVAFTELGLSVRFLDTLYFSGFCSDSKDVRVVKTVHANCCRSISAKMKDLSGVLRDWEKFNNSIDGEQGNMMMKGGNGAKRFQWSRHNACADSWKKPQKP